MDTSKFHYDFPVEDKNGAYLSSVMKLFNRDSFESPRTMK